MAASTGACTTSSTGSNQPKRVLVAKFFDETNTFIPEKFTLDMAKERAIYGDDMLTVKDMVHGIPGTSLDGFLDVMEMFDVSLIGSISVKGDYRLITDEVFDYVTGHILDTLDQHQVDGVYLSMHGAGVTEGHHDMEGDTLELIRNKVGPDIPIVFTLDLHSTLTEKMAKNADAVSIYRTYPARAKTRAAPSRKASRKRKARAKANPEESALSDVAFCVSQSVRPQRD